MRLVRWLAGLLLLSAPLQGQTLQQVDSAKLAVTGETAKTLTFSFAWFDKNTLSDTLTYQLAWYDVDSTGHLAKQTANVTRARQQTFTVTKPKPWTSAPYEACVTPTYPTKTWFAVCASRPYLNFDTAGRTLSVYPDLQQGKILGGQVYTYAAAGDSLQLLARFDLELVKTPERSNEAPATVGCSMFVTRSLRVYQPSADRWNEDCQNAFTAFYAFYRWRHGADSTVQAIVDTLPLPALRCSAVILDGNIQRAAVCP